MHIGKIMIEEGSPAVDWRNGFHDLEVSITVVMLREVQKVSGSILINCDVDSRHLIQSHIMVTHCQYDGHQVAYSAGQ